jgi:23S rRNA (cytosine1962-C5)-methyltransferase
VDVLALAWSGHSAATVAPTMSGSSTVRSATLRKSLERALAAGHPWVFREALTDLDAAPGEVVTVRDGRGRFVARGIADAGAIGVRVFVTRDEPVDARLFAVRLREAAALRARVVPTDTDAYRLVHGEGDRLPGFVCDVYGAYATVQLDGAGAEAWRGPFLDALAPVLAERGVETVLVRTGKRAARAVECVSGPQPPPLVAVRERGMTLLVDLLGGQKTGLFLDHRESRAEVRGLARGARVLNLYGYTGGFSIAAGLGGAASVTTVDIAPRAIELAEETWRRNGLPDTHRAVVSDVPEFLAAAAARGERWDVVVCDPPSFAPNERALAAALEGYRSLHRACLKVLAPGGLYVAASCSSHVDRDDFDATLRDVPLRPGAALQVLSRGGGAADHPRLAAFPEGDYLKIVVARVVG